MFQDHLVKERDVFRTYLDGHFSSCKIFSNRFTECKLLFLLVCSLRLTDTVRVKLTVFIWIIAIILTSLPIGLFFYYYSFFFFHCWSCYTYTLRYIWFTGTGCILYTSILLAYTYYKRLWPVTAPLCKQSFPINQFMTISEHFYCKISCSVMIMFEQYRNAFPFVTIGQ